jgi:hypothetical protein
MLGMVAEIYWDSKGNGASNKAGVGQLLNARIDKDGRFIEQRDSNGGWPALDDVIANRNSLNFSKLPGASPC